MLHKFNRALAPTKEHYSENYLKYWFDIVSVMHIIRHS